MIDEKIKAIILEAEAKALATYSDEQGINVVPVSTVTLRNDKIILMNYFMGKTFANLNKNPHVALTCWKKLEGLQIKAHVEYQDSGALFDEIKTWIAEILPSRTLKGILVLSPKEIFDISATAEKPGTQLYPFTF